MSSRLPRRVATTALVDRLAGIQHVTVYLRRVGHSPGHTVNGKPADLPPPTISDKDLRVRPYIVVHPSAGADGPDNRLDGSVLGRKWQPQLTCVVGDETALDVLVDVVTDRVCDWRPVFEEPHDDIDVGRFRLLDGYDPGPSRRDDDITPARYWTPLLLTLPIYA